jgi:hypothetical protein
MKDLTCLYAGKIFSKIWEMETLLSWLIRSLFKYTNRNTWADIDNDGDIDCFIVSTSQPAPSSHLYLNDGSAAYQNNKWSYWRFGFKYRMGCAFGDFNNDSYADLVIAAAFGFSGINHPNRLFLIMVTEHLQGLIQLK